jgi:CMP-N-acetylneuraminic acid synthetase
VVSVTNANSSHPRKLKLIENGLLKPFQEDSLQPTRRQDFGFDVYRTNGAIYLVRHDVLMQEGSFYGSCPRPLLMPAERSIDIDTQLDFEMAEFLYRRSKQNHS